jgi:hypothetical protein
LKCNLFTPEVEFCGRIFNADGVRTDPKKVQTLVDLPLPQTARDLQQFIFGSQWMNRHIPAYASRILPLTTLYEELMKRQPKRTKGYAAKVQIGDKWTAEHSVSFTDIKNALANSTLLSFPDREKPKVVIADASEAACAGFVTQIPPDDRGKHPREMRHEPLGFWGHKFQGSERNWTMTVKEGYALKGTIFALEYCFLPSKHRTLLVTDHKNLIALAASDKWSKPTSEMLERWIQMMQRIPYDIQHIDGDDNYFADIMSRWGYTVPKPIHVRSLSFRAASDRLSTRVRPLQKEDFAWPTLEVIAASQRRHLHQLERKKRGGDPCGTGCDSKGQTSLLKNKHGRLIIPDADVLLRLRLAVIAHAGERCGHVGQRESLAKLREHFTWKGMERDVKSLCQECLHCAPLRGGKRQPRPLGSQVHGRNVGQVVHTDVLFVDQPSREGFSNILLLYDDFSGLVWLQPVASADANDLANLLSKWRAHYGTPEVLVSDQASYYKANVVRLFCEKTGIQRHLVVSYTHFSNGTVEVVNSHILSLLRALISELRWDRLDWPYLLSSVEHTMNHRRQTSRAGKAAVEITGGRKDDPFHSVVRRPDDDDWMVPPRSDDISVHCQRLEQSLKRLHKDVNQTLDHSREMARLRQNRLLGKTDRSPRFEIGEYVLVAMSDDQYLSTPKPLRRWQGPYRIVDLLSDWVVEVEDLIHKKKTQVHISRIRFYCDKHLAVTTDVVEQYAWDCQKWEVEKLLDLRKSNRRLELLVAWKGFQECDNSWEPVARLMKDVPQLCREYKVPHPHLKESYKRCIEANSH